MNAVIRKSRGHAAWKLIATITACSILTGCDDGPTAPTAVPTPVQVPNVTGNWQGRFSPGNILLCDGATVAAAATLSQNGSRVSGTMTTRCAGLPGGAFQAVFQSRQFRGTLLNNATALTATGSATSTHMSVLIQGALFLNGTFELDR